MAITTMNKFYISLTTCTIEPLITQVLEKLFENTTVPFTLSICDNASLDNTLNVARKVVNKYIGRKEFDVRFTRLTKRVVSVNAINQSFEKYFEGKQEYSHVVKLDHDYGVPKDWDTTLIRAFEARPDLHLVCPSVLPKTPKGMQYYSQGHEPEHISNTDDMTFYHYTGIAGYAHSWRDEDFKRLGRPTYRTLNQGVVFGSEDADMSLRCKSIWGGHCNAYIFNSQGWHWSKPDIGHLEDEWKGLATFGKTYDTLEEWLAKQ